MLLDTIIHYRIMPRACGDSMTVDHVFTCRKGGYSFLRHNKVCDIAITLGRSVPHTTLRRNFVTTTSEDLQIHLQFVRWKPCRLDICIVQPAEPMFVCKC